MLTDATPGLHELRSHYCDRGWVLLDSVISSDEARMLHAELLRLAALGNAGFEDKRAFQNDPRFQQVLRTVNEPSRRSEIFRQFVRSERLGRIVAAVAGHEERGVQVYQDIGFVKPSRLEAGIGTGFHQDFAHWPIDRKGGATLWIALKDLPAESGTLRFVDGSHEWGPLGRYDALDQDWVIEHPEVAVSISSPHDMSAGSATLHDGLTLHGAGPNATDGPRVAYGITYQPLDVRYTGAPCRMTDNLGLKNSGYLEHDYFPVVVPASR